MPITQGPTMWDFTDRRLDLFHCRRFRTRHEMLFAYCLPAVLAALFLWAAPRVQAENFQSILITQAVDESKLVTLGGNTRPEAKAKYDRGRVADNLLMEHVLLLLKRSPEQERDLEKFIDDLHDSSSPVFHHWLTAAEFGERFGIAKQDRDTIKDWLRSHGLKVNVEYPSGQIIDFSGTAGQIREAFHTEIHSLNVKGTKHIANMSDPRIPAALAPAVAGVVSLHDFRPHAMFAPRADYTVSEGGTKYYLVAPGDLATIYNLNPLFSEGISGQGQTIVVIEDSDVYADADWTSFRSVFGLSSYTDGSFTQINPAPPSGTNNCSDPGANGNDREAIIDAEYASAAAPSAAIVLASCANTSTFGGLIALQNLLNESGTPPALVSMSYGECEAGNGASSNAAFSSTFQQAVAEGVSVFVSAGDHAAAACDISDPDAIYGIAITGWGSSPYNVSVGGTDFGDTFAGTNSTYWAATNSKTYESAKSYVPEIPWNDSCASSLVAEFEGFGQTYGSSGFCNSSKGEANFQNTVGGGGGPSACATGTPAVSGFVGGTCAGWPKPSYQSILGNPGDGVRDIPDVSLFAATGVWLHYYPYCFSGSGGVPCTEAPVNWPGAGGTSFSSPIMAGIQALVNQKAGARQGNPNFVYYSLAAAEYGTTGDKACNSTLGKTADSACIFYDVTQGDNDVDCVGTQTLVNCYLPSGSIGVLSTANDAYQPAFATTTGWDFASGIGTVNAYNLVNNWPAGFTLTADPSTLSIGQGGQGTTAITITPSNGFSGTVTFSASGLPAGVTAAFTPNPSTTGTSLTLTASATAAAGTVTVTVTGTSNGVIQTLPLSITVTPSFTLSAAPSTLSITQSSQGTSTITITPAKGFSGNVTLSASGLPSGVTAKFSPNPATSTSTLTLTASATASTGTATVTVTGISGSVTQTTTINLTVTPAPSFTLSANPSSLSVLQGGQGTSTITITPSNGFSGNVTLSASGLPKGVTAAFTPNPATSTSALTLTASATAATGTATVTITGTSGSLTETTTISLTVSATPTFTLSVNPSALSIVQGGQVTSTITITPVNGFSGSVTLSASGLPSGVTAAFSPNPATSTSSLTLTASATAATGTATVTVTGISGSLTETTTINLTVTAPPTFALSANPSSLSIVPGGQGTSTITITPANGFSGSVSLSASGLPNGVTAAFSPNPATTTSTLTLTASATAGTGTVTVTITGMSGSLTETTTLKLTVAASPTYTLSANPSSLTIAQGSQGTSTITITPANGFSGSVTLSASGLPNGVTAAFTPNPATSTSTLTLTAGATASAGTATVTVTGISGSLAETTTVNLTVTLAPTYTLSANPNSLAITQGAKGTSAITIAPANGFSGNVTLSASGLPSGVTAAFSPNPATSASTLTLTASTTASVGTATVTVTGISGALSASTTIALTVNPLGNFTLKAKPTALKIFLGGNGTSTITITSQSSFNSAVTLSAGGLPSGVTATFKTNPATPPANGTTTSVLTLTASATAATGTATVTVTGASGSLNHSTTIALTVTSGVQTAVYDSTLGAPECANVGTSCDSGPSLLLGRGQMSGGVEPNQPNTINDSCADGSVGTFHTEESNDRIVVTSTSGALTHGKTATVTATVWAWSATQDFLDLYYAANANNPTWVFIKTISPTKTGAQELSATFKLPTGSLQAVRAQFRYLGTASSCTTGSYNDHDDLIFTVQ
ncbi:MAG: S53 family peptidase [Terriglobales bacterium]